MELGQDEILQDRRELRLRPGAEHPACRVTPGVPRGDEPGAARPPRSGSTTSSPHHPAAGGHDLRGDRQRRVMTKPSLVKNVRSSDLSAIDEFKAEQLRRPHGRGETAQTVTELMTSVVDNGTASGAAAPGAKVADRHGGDRRGRI
ncbi:hypothetical protein QJS66_11680 [Kocuria rhizophila]|nr:hypothetical protein QJS66_11680 [Kocuria rhizophila]